MRLTRVQQRDWIERIRMNIAVTMRQKCSVANSIRSEHRMSLTRRVAAFILWLNIMLLIDRVSAAPQWSKERAAEWFRPDQVAGWM